MEVLGIFLVYAIALIALVAVAITIAGPSVVEKGIRRALADDALRPTIQARLQAKDTVKCLQCGAEMRDGADSCWKCGWTYAPE